MTSRQRHDAATEEAVTSRPETRLGTAAVCGATVMPVTAATTAPGASDATRGAGSLVTFPPDAARLEAPPGIQIGARAHRAASAGGGIRVTATIDDAVDEDAQNDAVSRRRLLSGAAPRVARRSRESAESDDLQRKRKHALTADRGRRVLGSRCSGGL